ncbi:membrane protein AbrB duplication [Leptolyngbyaceae cyanobacterium JSC-12]|nr:membrane protein AbrB duplication [Leptolyngbyaceae cyanobacterium JSC-12]
MSQAAPRPAIRITPSLMPFLMIFLELLLAAVIGFCLLLLGSDGTSWILGGIAAGAIAFVVGRFYFNLESKPNRTARKIGQLLVGLTVGFSVQHSNWLGLSADLPLFILLTGCLLLGGATVAFIYARVERTDLLTGLLATTPGNIGVMASIAADYGSNPALVSLVQLMRFTAVTFAIPFLSNISHPNDAWATLYGLAHHAIDTDAWYLFWLGSVLTLAGISVKLGANLRIPVPGLMCPLAIGIGFNALFNAVPFFPVVDFNPPTLLNVLGQILLGITIGEYWGMNPHLGKWTIARATIPATLTLLVGLSIAGIAKWLTAWDWLTCILVTAPGGSPEMIWIALTLNQNVEVVTAGHLVRLIAINALLPVMISAAGYVQRSPHLQSVRSWLTASRKLSET